MNTKTENKPPKNSNSVPTLEANQNNLNSNEDLKTQLLHLETEVEALKEVLNKLIGQDQINHVLVDKIVVTPGDDFIGTNWHAAETSKVGIGLRWTGPGALATMQLPLLRKQKLKAVFSTFTQKNNRQNIDKIRVFVDGNEIIPILKDTEKIEFFIPTQKYVSSFTEIGILTDGTYQSKDKEGKVIDERWLGCAFKGLSISP